ncbi:hypothetical protein EKO04_000284 [Ascochyta lentis]|uniref:Uncharacterized protein n=1 Tax=Ascochyta lentis TaxID=205686 RepID=A0A8H7ML27_9PLEO|nr:hypothetical protein EKO04_000284 [Ascochyta lentis]
MPNYSAQSIPDSSFDFKVNIGVALLQCTIAKHSKRIVRPVVNFLDAFSKVFDEEFSNISIDIFELYHLQLFVFLFILITVVRLSSIVMAKEDVTASRAFVGILVVGKKPLPETDLTEDVRAAVFVGEACRYVRRIEAVEADIASVEPAEPIGEEVISRSQIVSFHGSWGKARIGGG